MRVTLLYFDGCPNWETTNARLERLAAELGFDLDHRRLDTREQAERSNFRGSPSVLVDGRDAFPSAGEPVGLSCRMYATDHGLTGAPSEQQLRAVLARSR